MLPNTTSLDQAGSQNLTDLDNGLPFLDSLFIGFFLSFVIFLSISGNILVVLSIYTDRNLRKTSNLFLVSLAVADLFVATLVMTFAVANDILGYWVFSMQFCNIWLSFDIMCSTASILNLCAISLDRYLHIKNPLRYEAQMTTKIAICGIALVWILSSLISFLPINIGWHQAYKDNITLELMDINTSPICTLEINPTYAVVSSIVSFYAPCIVMLALYTKLYMYARQHVKNIKAMSKPQLGGGNYDNHSSHVSDHKAAVTLGIIMGVFLICWSPFFFINIIAAFCQTCIPQMLFKILTWLGYINSALNPIIYSIFNQEFREAFRKILTSLSWCTCCDRYCENLPKSCRRINQNGMSPKSHRHSQSSHTGNLIVAEKVTSI